MELLVCLLVLGVAWGRQQAISYQNFRASHGQGHPTYGADGSWSQRFGGGPRIAKEGLWPGAFSAPQRFAAFPSSQTFVHQPQPFFNSRPATHIHTSGPPPPPPPQINSFQSSQINYDPPIPGNQNILNSGPHIYQTPTVSSFGPDLTHPSLPPQSYGNDRLPQFADAVQNYNDGIATAPPAHIEPQSYHPNTNGPIENYDTRGNEEYPRNEGSPTPIYNEFTEGPRVESSPPSYNPEQPKSDYPPQNNGNSYNNEGTYNNYEEPKRDFGPTNIEPNLQNPVQYNTAPVTDVRNNNDALITDVRTHNEPISDLRNTDRPSSEVVNNRDHPGADLRSHGERPSDSRIHSDRPSPDLRSHDNRPPNDLRNGNDRPRPHSDGPLTDLRSNERPISELKNTNERPPNDFRPNNDRPLTDLRYDTRPHFGPPAKTNYGPGAINQNAPPQGIRNKQFKPSQPSSSPVDRPHGLDANNRAGVGPGPVGVNQGPPGSKPFRDEKKPVSNPALGQKGGFNNDGTKQEFSDEDKSQSFESEFQSSEIGGQSFEADIPDFGSDESYFNSQEGYGSFESGGRGSFETSGERKGGYERPAFNPHDNKRTYKADIRPDFQSSIESAPGDSAEPRNNKKFKSEPEARHRGVEDKKINVEDKKAPFPTHGEKKGPIGGVEKGFPSARTASTLAPAKDTIPLANTFNKKPPAVTAFRPSAYTGDKFVPFVPIDKPFPQRGRGPYTGESRFNYQIQAPDKRASFAQEKLSSSVQNVPK
nr:sporozoite surface protein 2-like [Halyomorpha halys]